LLDFHVWGSWPDYYQTGAAMRLAYYFPDVAGDSILARLDELETAACNPQRTADVPFDEMVKAVAWSASPRLAARMLTILRTTTDPGTLLAVLPAAGKEHDELVFRRIAEQLKALPPSHNGPYGSLARPLLIVVGERFPQRAETVFRDYLKPGTVERHRTLIYVLREICGDLAIPLLTPLLDDKRSVGESYSLNAGDGGSRYPIRVCDEAAVTIAECSKIMECDMEGSPADSDRQIAAMRQKIAEMKPLK